MAYNAAFDALSTYAQEQGISFAEALNSMKQHPDFQKPKRGRPRKEQVQDEPSPSARPRGRPPAGAIGPRTARCISTATATSMSRWILLRLRAAVDALPREQYGMRIPRAITLEGKAYQKVEKPDSSRPVDALLLASTGMRILGVTLITSKILKKMIK